MCEGFMCVPQQPHRDPRIAVGPMDHPVWWQAPLPREPSQQLSPPRFMSTGYGHTNAERL